MKSSSAFITTPFTPNASSSFIQRAVTLRRQSVPSLPKPASVLTTTPCATTSAIPPRPSASASASASASSAEATAESPMVGFLDKVPAQFRSTLLRLPEDAAVAELGARHTKIIATVGPSSCSSDDLLRLIAEGVNVFRLNMSHGDFAWHKKVIEEIRTINLQTPFLAAVMIDLGSLDSLRLGEFSRNPVLSEGDKFTLTIRHEPEYEDGVSEVSSDALMSLVVESDLLSCQAEGGGVVELLIMEKTETDVVCKVVSPGTLSSRGEISVRGKSLNVTPNVREEDFNVSIARAVLGCPPDHLQLAIDQRVEYIALSFVESADQVNAVKNLLRDRGANIGIIAKIESANALRRLESIADAADGVMVARGDLGATINYEKVPYWQAHVANVCRRYGKPVLISTHFLDSMVLYPTPTRAEVTDMTEAVKQRVDALVLTAETASGRFPFKAVTTMNSVLLRMQERLYSSSPLPSASASIQNHTYKNVTPALVKDPSWWTAGVGDVAENAAQCAADIADRQNADAILVFTQKGLMATLTSRCRPKAPIFAFTATPVVRNKMNLLYGVRPFRLQFYDNPEETIDRAITILKERQAVSEGDLIVVVADVLGGRQGATDSELRHAFDEVSLGNKYITAPEVRSALRLISLKVSDRVEAMLGMRDVDIADAGREITIRNETPNEAVDEDTLGQYDFARFKEFASTAKEIVHTLQLRTV